MIFLIGKFFHLHDEEYIARSFEMIGEKVLRIEDNKDPFLIKGMILDKKPKVILFTKYRTDNQIQEAIRKGREWGLKTVCWMFDLYIGYEREYRVPMSSYFKADYVFSSDGGHDEEWKKYGVNHKVVRQGIFTDDCWIHKNDNPEGVAFFGSENPYYPLRTHIMLQLAGIYAFTWYGRRNTNDVRGKALNVAISQHKIIVGDSVYSPHYWSNRVVETLGRGGFLIHREVPGLKEEFPDLVTYDGSFADLVKKIDYYLEHEDERQEIIKKNFDLVKSKYTMDKKCKELLSYIS